MARLPVSPETTATTLAIGVMGGIAFWLIGLPLPWLSGAAAAVAGVSLSGRTLGIAQPLREPAILALGLTMGASVTPETLTLLPRWPVTLIGLAGAMLSIMASGALYLERVHGLDRATARLAAMPGALNFVMALSLETHSDPRRVAIIQIVRMTAILLLLPSLVALGLVLGANVGSGVLAMIVTSSGKPELRRLPLGNFIFKVVGALLVIPFLPQIHTELQQWISEVHQQVVVFHLIFNGVLALMFIGFTGPMARLVERLLPTPAHGANGDRPRHLDPVALATPSLAISCAAREALHQADVVETMLRGVLPVMRDNDLALAERLRKMDDTVDELYSAIKFYLTQISREALSEREGRRWADIVSFTINMEQIGDSIERVLQDLEDKKIRKSRSFSDAGMAEICHLHERLLANLRLGMSVFLDGHVRDAKKLLEEKARFRDLEHEYAASHIGRLRDNTAQSIETSSLHLDLISDLKRINSHICSIAYPILESAGALRQTRIRNSQLVTQQQEDTIT